MGRFKAVDYSPRFLAVDLSRQLVPGTFEYALHHLLEHEIDLREHRSALSQRRSGRRGLHAAGAAQDRVAGLLLWDRELTGDGSGVSRQRALHCHLLAPWCCGQPSLSCSNHRACRAPPALAYVVPVAWIS